jgi:long-chain acyl-CoA synthetase
LLEAPIQLSKLLHGGLNDRPNDAALVSMEGVWSWSDLDRAPRRLAAHYLALGLQPGDRVASLMPNRTGLFVHYLACFKAGLVMTPLNYRYTPAEIDHALTVSGARIILAHAEREADIAASKASGLLLGVIFYGDERKEASLEALLKTKAT